MNFAQISVNEKEYNEKIKELLLDDDCYIFLDTNILSFLFKLNQEARNDLYDWFTKLKEKNRLKIPAWVIHEYNNKLKNQQLNVYNNILSDVKTFNKKFDEIYKNLHYHIQDSHLTNNNSTTSTEYLENTLELSKNIKEHLQVVQKIDPYIIHNEVENNLKDCILKSDIFQLSHEASIEASNRLLNRLSPISSKSTDSKKSENPYGDYIIWKEILKTSEENKKVLFITLDAKDDWVYTPKNKYSEELSKNIKNEKPKITLAQPDLIHEYFLTTGNDNFLILNMEHLAIGLMISGFSANNLARAIQAEVKEANIKNIESNEVENNVDSSEVENNDTENIIYQLNENNHSIENEEIIEIIEKFKSYNWYTQNSAISQLNNMNPTNINKDDLFIRLLAKLNFKPSYSYQN